MFVIHMVYTSSFVMKVIFIILLLRSSNKSGLNVRSDLTRYSSNKHFIDFQ